MATDPTRSRTNLVLETPAGQGPSIAVRVRFGNTGRPPLCPAVGVLRHGPSIRHVREMPRRSCIVAFGQGPGTERVSVLGPVAGCSKGTFDDAQFHSVCVEH